MPAALEKRYMDQYTAGFCEGFEKGFLKAHTKGVRNFLKNVLKILSEKSDLSHEEALLKTKKIANEVFGTKYKKIYTDERDNTIGIGVEIFDLKQL